MTEAYCASSPSAEFPWPRAPRFPRRISSGRGSHRREVPGPAWRPRSRGSADRARICSDRRNCVRAHKPFAWAFQAPPATRNARACTTRPPGRSPRAPPRHTARWLPPEERANGDRGHGRVPVVAPRESAFHLSGVRTRPGPIRSPPTIRPVRAPPPFPDRGSGA